MLWARHDDPEVVAAITGIETTEAPDPEVLAQVFTALSAASEILTVATAHLIHPAGSQTEEFIGTRSIRRLSPVYGPVTRVVSISTVDTDGTATPTDRAWQLIGNTVHFMDRQRGTVFYRDFGACGPEQTTYRLAYEFGSTLSRSARSAVLAYAHQLWLAEHDHDECGLPERTTSITREGIGIELMTPQDFLDKGRVGLPHIDTWLAQVNSKRALRPSAVYTPDSPPGVGTALRRR